MSLGNVLLNSNKTGILCKCHYGCSVNALLLGINVKWFSYINLFTQGAQYFWQQISDMEGSFKDVLTTVQFINSFLNRKQCLAFYIFKNIDKTTKTTTNKCYQWLYIWLTLWLICLLFSWLNATWITWLFIESF